MGLLKKELKNGRTLGEHWAETLKDLDSYYLEEVCGEYADLKRPLPDPTDQLVFEIREEVTQRTRRDMDRYIQHQKYHEKPSGVLSSDEDSFRPIRESWWLGVQVKKGRITREQCAARTQELADWSAGLSGPPEWLEHPGEDDVPINQDETTS